MHFRQLLRSDGERAVSPVIGVILMVAITVILAAVIGTFVLGLGDTVEETSPNAQFAIDYEDNSANDTADITHEGGESIQDARLNISGTNVINATDGTTHSFDGGWSEFGPDGKVGAGDTATVNTTTVAATSDSYTNDTYVDLDLSEATLRIIWTSEGGGSSAVLKEWDGPDA